MRSFLGAVILGLTCLGAVAVLLAADGPPPPGRSASRRHPRPPAHRHRLPQPHRRPQPLQMRHSNTFLAAR